MRFAWPKLKITVLQCDILEEWLVTYIFDVPRTVTSRIKRLFYKLRATRLYGFNTLQGSRDYSSQCS